MTVKLANHPYRQGLSLSDVCVDSGPRDRFQSCSNIRLEHL